MDNSSFELTWGIPINPIGRIDYYTVRWNTVAIISPNHSLCIHYQVYYGYCNQPMQTVNVTNFTCTYTLDNLTPYTEYCVYVTAVKLIGDTGRPLEGNKSRTVTGRTLAGGETLQDYMKC